MPMFTVTGCTGAVGSTKRTCCRDGRRESILATSNQPCAVSPSPWMRNTVAVGTPCPGGETMRVLSADAMVGQERTASTCTGTPRPRGTHLHLNSPLPPPAPQRLPDHNAMVISKRAGVKRSGGAPPPARGGVAKADWREGFKKPQAGVSDMTLLTQITNEAVNENLQKRFANGEIYTYIGNVLISVNPFRDLGIYSDETLASYRGKNRLEMPPHVFAIAEGAYYNMVAYKESQCVIISGESGAGKTEAAKRIMQYIAAVSGEGRATGISNIKDMVLATNPLLESFGCAKTLRNNNSSRHGKYLEVMFDTQGAPVGATITNYLLEKGRVVQQVRNERNFHVFYQFTKAASQEQREMFGLQGPEAYAYTADSGCLEVPGIDDRADFAAAQEAMRIIGISPEDQLSILRMLAAILWLGNVNFVENDAGEAQIANTDVPAFVAYLLEVDTNAVQRALTMRIMETQRGGRRGSVYEVPLNAVQAASVRDALSKAIYNNLFDWIVARLNRALNALSGASYVIGVLDIYGFEIFENNSFEQLCINLSLIHI